MNVESFKLRNEFSFALIKSEEAAVLMSITLERNIVTVESIIDRNASDCREML